MSEVPTVWDETIGLAGDVDKYAAVARRKGDVWYVSAIGSWEPQSLELALPFLGEGEWKAEIFEDGMNADRDATDYVRREANLTAADKLAVKMAPGGGFTARIYKAGGGMSWWK
jgi:alpha-glucosidase